MKFDNFEIQSSPHFRDVWCPKHGNEMWELDNGWFSICWYCPQCKYPYTLELRKMRKVNKEGLDKAIAKHEAIKAKQHETN